MRFSREDVTVAAQRGAARLLDAVPAPVAVRLAGTTRDIDGQRLDPHLALLLAVTDRVRPDRARMSVESQRAAMRENAIAIAGAPIRVGAVRDLDVDGADAPLRARLYTPEGPSRALVVYFHGGGWVVGDLDTHDQVARLICRYSGVQVLSVDYRLAPEHPYPAAVDDAVAAYAWACAHAGALGADPSRLAVAGDSAGGNLAAIVAQTARDDGLTAPLAQLLLYPGTDASRRYPSKDLFAEGYFLTKKQMDWYWDTYSVGGARTDPRLSPLCAADLTALAPAVVATAAFDPLRDEGEAYANALRSNGNRVVLRRAEGLVHGYLSMAVHTPSFRESLAVAGAFAALLDTA